MTVSTGPAGVPPPAPPAPPPGPPLPLPFGFPPSPSSASEGGLLGGWACGGGLEESGDDERDIERDILRVCLGRKRKGEREERAEELEVKVGRRESRCECEYEPDLDGGVVGVFAPLDPEVT